MRVFLLSLPWLAAGLAARAQNATTGTVMTTAVVASPYQVHYDSLQARASRIRASAAARTLTVKAGFIALGGTRRAISSFGTPRVVPMSGGDAVLRNVRIKKEAVKHKTRGAVIREVTYFSGSRRPRFYEYYEDGQLVQLELYAYPLDTGSSGNKTFMSMRWLRGGYLTVRQGASTSVGGRLEQVQTFVEPAIIAQ